MNVPQIITAEMLESLPAPAQRYLTYSGVIGKAWIDTVELTYTGRFRLALDKPWLTINAHQVYSTNAPAFQWKAKLKIFGLPLFYGQDTYKAGQGHMFGKLVGIRTIFDMRGAEMNQGTMMRYLNEMMWFPTAYLGENITWQPVDNYAVDVSYHEGEQSVTARLFIDDSGRLLNFVGKRYRTLDEGFSLDTWATPMVEYRQIAGFRLPVYGAAVWYLPEGDLNYAELRLADICYNEPIAAF